MSEIILKSSKVKWDDYFGLPSIQLKDVLEAFIDNNKKKKKNVGIVQHTLSLYAYDEQVYDEKMLPKTNKTGTLKMERN